MRPTAAGRKAPALRGLLLDACGLGLSVGVGSLVVAPLAAGALSLAWPRSQGTVSLPPLAAFLVAFVGLDYLQYGTHRLFHGRLLWRFHLTHHTLSRLNGIGAFRHSLWECLLSPLFWACGALAHLLADPFPLFVGVSTGLALDVWRHSPLRTRSSGPVSFALETLLVTPAEHAVHHLEPAIAANYGANLKLWDRLHGTYVPAGDSRATYGVPTRDGPLRLLFGAPHVGAASLSPAPSGAPGDNGDGATSFMPRPASLPPASADPA